MKPSLLLEEVHKFLHFVNRQNVNDVSIHCACEGVCVCVCVRSYCLYHTTFVASYSYSFTYHKYCVLYIVSITKDTTKETLEIGKKV